MISIQWWKAIHIGLDPIPNIDDDSSRVFYSFFLFFSPFFYSVHSCSCSCSRFCFFLLWLTKADAAGTPTSWPIVGTLRSARRFTQSRAGEKRRVGRVCRTRTQTRDQKKRRKRVRGRWRWWNRAREGNQARLICSVMSRRELTSGTGAGKGGERGCSR